VNPHVRYFDGLKRGYLRCDVSREAWRTDVRAVDTIAVREAPVHTNASFVVPGGTSTIVPPEPSGGGHVDAALGRRAAAHRSRQRISRSRSCSRAISTAASSAPIAVESSCSLVDLDRTAGDAHA
jgi:hypothetical protein